MRINVIWAVQSHFKKHSVSDLTQIKLITAPSRPNEGRLAIVTNAGRDAVDADGAADEQHVKRTAKSCGSDAPTLASSFAVNARRRWQTSPVTGKSTKETVKTIARGMPGVSGVTVVTMLVCFLFCMRGCGRIARPAFPAPSDVSGRKIMHHSGASRRGNVEVCFTFVV